MTLIENVNSQEESSMGPHFGPIGAASCKKLSDIRVERSQKNQVGVSHDTENRNRKKPSAESDSYS